MSKVAAIAQDGVALQLGLAGIRVERVASPEAAEALLAGMLESDLDVLILQEELRDGISEWHRNLLRAHRGRPLIVYCPSFEDEESDVDAYLSAIIKPAVGYEIRLE